MNLLWINGWGLKEEALLRHVSKWRPDLGHQVIQPYSNWRDELLARVDDETRVCGYSLGAFLLGTVDGLLTDQQKGVLFAPFFPEAGGDPQKGARTGWLRAMRLQLRHDPQAVLLSFARFASVPSDEILISCEVAQLQWGLGAMLNFSIIPKELHGYRVIAGGRDPLLSANDALVLAPQVELCPNCGHYLPEILASVDLS
jgi:hypothetical protein